MTYSDIQGMPKEDDVTTVQIDNHQLSVVEVTPENYKYLAKVALSMYANEPCRICGSLLTMEDMENGAVFAGYSNGSAARAAHKACWERSPSSDGVPNKDWVHQ